jgi:hypothetical protein
MCPVCLATAAWIAVASVSTGGMTALVINKVVTRKTANNISTITSSKEDHHG